MVRRMTTPAKDRAPHNQVLLGVGYWTDGAQDPRKPVGRMKLSDLMNYDDRPSYRHKRLWEFHLNWAHEKHDFTWIRPH